jgi:hypothetical protein
VNTAELSELQFRAAGSFTSAPKGDSIVASVCPSSVSLALDELQAVDVTSVSKKSTQLQAVSSGYVYL